ncbi:MAG: iron-siderophore ABC transporter substrate-binding protein [Dehalococcoidia bacterium]
MTTRYHPGQPIRIEDVTRRELLMVTTIVALFAACGDGDAEERADGDGTALIHDFFGEVKVPTRPQRVIAGDSPTMGNMITLGVRPVGAYVNVNSLPGYLADQMEGVVDLTAEAGGLDLEKAATLKPDLIITLAGSRANPFNKENCGRYRLVAPTFCYEYWYSTEEEIKRNLTEVAKVLGQEEQARQVLAAYDARVAELKRRVAAAGLNDKPVSVLRLSGDGNYSIRVGTSESIVFRALGIAQPPDQRDPAAFRIVVSLERLHLLDEADTVYIYVDDNAKDQQSIVVDSPLYQNLNVVKNGRVHFVNSGIWNSVDMIGAMRIMDDIERTFIAPAEER